MKKKFLNFPVGIGTPGLICRKNKLISTILQQLIFIQKKTWLFYFCVSPHLKTSFFLYHTHTLQIKGRFCAVKEIYVYERIHIYKSGYRREIRGLSPPPWAFQGEHIQKFHRWALWRGQILFKCQIFSSGGGNFSGRISPPRSKILFSPLHIYIWNYIKMWKTNGPLEAYFRPPFSVNVKVHNKL